MRRIFTTRQAAFEGMTGSALRWAVRTGRLSRLERGVYIEGNAAPTDIERALATVVVSGGLAAGWLAAHLHDFDSPGRRGPFVAFPLPNYSERAGSRRRWPLRIVDVGEYLCTDGLQTLLDLAAHMDDERWEQALESALRKKLVGIDDLDEALQVRRVGNPRIRRVLEARPEKAPPTESLLETLAVQLVRSESRLPTPTRQVVVEDPHGRFVARVDLAWPEQGIFVELDGEHHKDQPVYDARRETAVVAATGWLPARFTWTEITRFKRATLNRLLDIHSRAASRRI